MIQQLDIFLAAGGFIFSSELGINEIVGLVDAQEAQRQEEAKRRGVPAYVIFHDTTLAELARLRPRGMAHTMFATACAQASVPLIALIIGGAQARSLQEPPGLLGVLALNAFFVMLFVVSGLLFRHAGVTARIEPKA